MVCCAVWQHTVVVASAVLRSARAKLWRQTVVGF